MKPQQFSSEHQPFTVLHRDLSTGNQIGMLISVTQAMNEVLLDPEREANDPLHKGLVSGEVKLAAEQTFVRACCRLESILSDDSRWTTAFQTEIEGYLRDSYASAIKASREQQEASIAQKTAAREVTSPHFRYRPQLMRLTDGNWAAFLGDINDIENGILGLGACPQDALNSFDAAFKGEISPAVLQWLEQRELDIEAGKPLQPFPPTDKTNEHIEQVDRSGTGNPEEPTQ